MKETTDPGTARGDKSEAEAVLAFMAAGKIKSDELLMTFDEIPENVKKREKSGLRGGRFVALAAD